MSVHLQHVSIPRPPGSEDLTRAFYGDLLGFPEIPAPNSIQAAEVIWFKLGEDAELHCFREEPLGDASNRHFCLVVDDVAGIRQKLNAAGYQPYDVEVIPGTTAILLSRSLWQYHRIHINCRRLSRFAVISPFA